MTRSPEILDTLLVDPMIPQPMVVSKNIWETDDAFTLFLEPVGEHTTPNTFLPGQFNMLYMPGLGESAISISSDPERKGPIQHTIHRVGTVTSALAKLKHGDELGARGPFGSHWPVERVKGLDVCVVGGGIGLAPLRPVVYSIFRHRKDYGRVVLLYGARSPLDLLYRVELEQWSKLFHVDVLITVDHGDSTWKGYIGVVTTLFSYITLDSAATAAFVCGPDMMMQYTVREILARGLDPERVYLSLERNMKCAIGICGHCQYGPYFVCKDGPVFSYPQISHLFEKREI